MSDENIWTGPVVDAHHHFWDPIVNDHPWLRPDVTIPFRGTRIVLLPDAAE